METLIKCLMPYQYAEALIEWGRNKMADAIINTLMNMFDFLNDTLENCLKLLIVDPIDNADMSHLYDFLNVSVEVFMAFAFSLSAIFFLIGFYQDILERKGHCDFSFIIVSFMKLGLTQQVIKHSGELFVYIAKICNSIAEQISKVEDASITSINLDTIHESLVKLNLTELSTIQTEMFIIKLIIYLLYFAIIVSTYYRAIMLVLYRILAPLALAGISGKRGFDGCKVFVKSYITVCLQGTAIILSFIAYKYLLLDIMDMSVASFDYIWKLVISTAVLTSLVIGSQSFVAKVVGD